jgi:transcriptional regulator with XRE-family HTH domain
MNVGECIKVLRDSAGLKQRELAERAGISASLLSLVEANKREPTIKLLRDIARALGIPSAVLFAFALVEDESQATGPAAEKASAMTQQLFVAAQRMLAAQRLRRLRERQPA